MEQDRSTSKVTITGGDEGTEWVTPGRPPQGGLAAVDISIIDLVDSVVTLQRKHPDEDDADARDSWTYNASEQGLAENAGKWVYRLYIKAADYGSDTPTLEVTR